MSSSDRRAILTLFAALPLAACGFSPAYGPSGPAAGLMGQVRADDPQDKNAFDLVERLEERLGRSGQPKFLLSYTITTWQQGRAVEPDNSITRYQIFGRISFTLKDAATNAKLGGGVVTGFTAYSAVGSKVESNSAEADAKLRLMHLLADRIVTELVAAATVWNAK